jgi:hypothetical protein
MMPQLRTPLYPVFLAAVDIGLAGVLFLIAPVFGVLMAAAGLLVTVAIALRVRGHRSVAPRSKVSYDS